MKDKKSLSTIIAFAIALVLYVLIVTVIPFEKPASSWVAFSFGALSIIICCAVTLFAMLKGKGYKSKVYGLPVLKLGFIYLVAQMVVCLVFFVIGAFLVPPSWITLILSVILLGLLLIGILLTDNVRDVITEIDKKTEAEIKTMKTFSVDMNTVINVCSDPALRNVLEQLAEDFRYSDPVSSDKTEEIENTIKSELESLNALVASNDDNAGAKAVEIKNLLSTRNAICKSSK